MSACPINIFDPILLYLLPKLKRYSGQKPLRPVYVKVSYLQQQKTKAFYYCVRNCAVAFVAKQCLSMIQPIYKLKWLRSTSPTLAVWIKAALQIMLTSMQAMWLSLI